ncbi:MAG: terminase family protein [Pseudomonadota bacterium]
MRRLRFDWPVWARSNQSPPLSDWRTWLLLGGRGSGKTRTGAQWLNGVALADPHFPGNSGGRVALVGTNYEDIRDVMVEGESGLLAVSDRRSRPDWISSRRELVWPNGVIGKLFSSSDPEGLRGSQFGASWSDEVCKWSQPEETWDMLQFCLRLGDLPRQVVTTTPKPMKLLRKLIEDPTTVTTRSRTKDNAANLAEGFMAHIEQSYGNTRLGRQELDGELIEDREDALWSRDMIDAARVTHAPELGRIVVAVDPPAGSANGGASCGIVAAGMAQEGACYVLADKTMATAKPHQWAGEVVRLFRTLNADCVIAEVNQGGDMVRSVLTAADPAIPVRSVHASRGKWLRAEPVALMYERGIIHHVGQYPDLEDQMCALAPDGKANGVSPDRVDALVWAISELAILRRPKPRVRPV